MNIKPYRMLVVGMTQTGKTFWVRNFLLPLLNRYVVYDPDIQFGPEFGVIVHSIKDFIAEFVEKRTSKVIFQPDDILLAKPKKMVAQFNKLCEVINMDKDMFFIIDEIANVTLAGRVRPRMPEMLNIIIKRRMKDGIGVCATTQQLKDADVNYTSQTQLVVMFDMLPHDIDYLEEKLPIKLPIRKDGAVAVLDIERYHFFVYNHMQRRVYEDCLTVTRGYEGDSTWVEPIFEGMPILRPMNGGRLL